MMVVILGLSLRSLKKTNLLIEELKENELTKAPVEAIAANMAALINAQDLIANLNPEGFFAIGNFGKGRINSGSHSDVKGGAW